MKMGFTYSLFSNLVMLFDNEKMKIGTLGKKLDPV